MLVVLYYIYFWTSKGFSKRNCRLNLQLSYFGTKTRVEFRRSCLKQNKVTYDQKKVVNIYIFYEINKNSNISDYQTIENCLLGAVSLTKNGDTDKYKYSGYGIGFDRHGFFSHPSSGTGRNIIIFGVDMSSFTKFDNRKKNILILGKGPAQRLEHKLFAEKMYSVNFTEHDNKFSLSLHYNRSDSYLFLDGTEIYKFKSKDLEIMATLLCLGNISIDWSGDNMKNTGLNGYV